MDILTILELYREVLPFDSYTERYYQLCKARNEVSGVIPAKSFTPQLEKVEFIDNDCNWQYWENKFNPDYQRREAIEESKKEMDRLGYKFFSIRLQQYTNQCASQYPNA